MSRKPLKRKTKSARSAKPAVKASRRRKPATVGARKAKAAQPAKPSAKPLTKTSPKSSTKPSRDQKSNDLTALAAAGIKMLDLPVEPAWHTAIVFNLQLLFKHAAFVDAFALADETEPGPVFRA
jgi:Protein of unknown function (DUF4089)